MADISLKELAVTADAIVEAHVSTPAHEMRQEFMDDPCGGFVVQVYRLDVLTIRTSPRGTQVPAHVDAYDPVAWAEGMRKHEACLAPGGIGAGLPTAKVYQTPVEWVSGHELVVMLDWDGTRWFLTSQGSYDDVNRADKAARWAGVKQ